MMDEKNIEDKEQLELKWGTVKGWDNLSEASQALLAEFFKDEYYLSAMSDRPNEQRKAILCKLIDQLDGVIVEDCSDEIMTKEDAKKYVLEYGRGR